MGAGAILDINKDGLQDIFLGGNYYDNNIELGRYDADYGSLLFNSPQGLAQGQIENLLLEGQIRRIERIIVQGQICFLIAVNNGPLKLITFNYPQNNLQ